MFSKTIAKSLALGLALVVALAAAPQVLAGPALGDDLGGEVYGFLTDVWRSLARVIGAQDGVRPEPTVVPDRGEAERPSLLAVSDGRASDTQGELDATAQPHGLGGESEPPEDEFGPGVIPNG